MKKLFKYILGILIIIFLGIIVFNYNGKIFQGKMAKINKGQEKLSTYRTTLKDNIILSSFSDHVLKKGETLKLKNDYVIKLSETYDNDIGQGVQLRLYKIKNGKEIPNPISPLQLALYNKNGVTPYKTPIKNVYLALESVDKKNESAVIRKFDKCSFLVNECLNNPLSKNHNDYCPRYCPYEQLKNELSQSQGIFVATSSTEFTILNTYMLESFDLCSKKLENYMGIKLPQDKIFYKLFLDKNISGGLGATFDYVAHQSSNKQYLTKEQERIDQKIGGWGEYKKNLEADICPTEMAQGHEMVHLFLAGTPIGIGYCAESSAVCGAFNEGLAEYLKYKINNYQMTVDSFESVICAEDGYSYSWDKMNKKHKYYDFSLLENSDPDDIYETGLCVWDYIETTYGHEAFKNILKKLDDSRNVVSNNYMSYTNDSGYKITANYNILEDFIVPFTDDKIYEVFEKRFGIKKNNTYVAIPRAIDY